MTLKQTQKTLDLYPIDYPFETLVSRMSANPSKLKLDPDFQRHYKWDKEGWERASRFIESCLMRIPLPSCYFAEDQEGHHFVIDGVQRLTTIHKFFNDEFKLEGLTAFKELEGKKFSELGSYQAELEATTIRCIILRKSNPDGLVREIFSRLNQGSVLLSAQEIRHALYGGAFDQLLQELAQRREIKNFKSGKSEKSLKNSREAEEQVLRYFAFQQDLNKLSDRLSVFLDEYMAAKCQASATEIEIMRRDFHETLDKCIEVFADQAFVNTTKERTRRSLIYYDLLMSSFRTIDREQLKNSKEQIQIKFEEMCRNPEFQSSFNSGSQNKNAIIRRRKIWQDLLTEALKHG